MCSTVYRFQQKWPGWCVFIWLVSYLVPICRCVVVSYPTVVLFNSHTDSCDLFLDKIVHCYLSSLLRLYCQADHQLELNFTQPVPGLSSFLDLWVAEAGDIAQSISVLAPCFVSGTRLSWSSLQLCPTVTLCLPAMCYCLYSRGLRSSWGSWCGGSTPLSFGFSLSPWLWWADNWFSIVYNWWASSPVHFPGSVVFRQLSRACGDRSWSAGDVLVCSVCRHCQVRLGSLECVHLYSPCKWRDLL